MQARIGYDWLDGRFADLGLVDGEQVLDFPRQISSLFKLGWSISSKRDTATGTLYILSLPVRGSSAQWIALGCLAEHLDVASRAATKEDFLNKQPGDEAVVALTHGPSRGRRVTVKVRVEHIEGTGEGRRIKFRIVEGKKSHVGVAITMDYQEWVGCLRPGKTLIKGMARKIDPLRAIYSRLVHHPNLDWFVDQKRLVSIYGSVAAMHRDISDIAIWDRKRKKDVRLEHLLCVNLGKVHVASPRGAEGSSSREITILNGPEAVRNLQPGWQGVVIAILAWPEVDASIQTLVAPYLAADNPSVPELDVSGMWIPRQWTLLAAALGDAS